jgi:erythromycin esterase-like protein
MGSPRVEGATDRSHTTLQDALLNGSVPLRDDSELDPLIAEIGDACVVLLGEASHGTSEYYTWRARITKRLIQEKGFNFIAVEGDWPDCERVNRFIHGMDDAHESARDALAAFNRWPTWMWANAEMVELTEWLRRFNDAAPVARRVGFHGLDVYSLWESMDAVLQYLDRVDPEQARRARRAYGCFDPYDNDVQEYAMATRIVPTSCEDEAVTMLQELRRKATAYREDGVTAFFNAEQNAIIARNAERYYRMMVRGGPASWNVRDTHMIETLRRLHDHYGLASRSIVWEHNTHVGDARATDMAGAGMVNVGQLARVEWGADDVAIVGFGSYEGTVIAGEEWGAPMEVMRVPPARSDSWESIMHDTYQGDRLLFSRELAGAGAAFERRGHRAIGVVYDPAREARGNYVPTVLPARYDAFIYLDRTRAIRPLHMQEEPGLDAPETFPSGM